MTYPVANPADVADGDGLAHALESLVRFLKVLWYRRIYVIGALVVSALLGTLYYCTTPPAYEATAAVLITKTGPEIWGTAPMAATSVDSLIHTYEQLFLKDVVLEAALDRLAKMPSPVRVDLAGAPRSDWVDLLRRRLTVRAIRRTNIIELRYRSRTPAAAEAVVGAVVDAYLAFMEQYHKDVSVEVVSILDNERKEVEQQLDQKKEELLRKQREVGELNIADGAEILHPLVVRVRDLNETLVEVQKERVKLEASLGAIQAAVRTGGDLQQQLAAVEPAVGKELMATLLGITPEATRTVSAIESKLIDDRAKLQRLLVYYGPAHPRVVEVQKAIENAEQYLASYQRRVASRLAEVHRDQLGPMLISMVRQRLAEAQSHEYELQQEYDRAAAEAAKLNDRLAELQILKNELQRLRKLHETLLNRIANIDINQNRADIRVALVTQPTADAEPVSPRLSLVGLFCLVGGLATGAAVVYIVDLLDDRFRTANEITRQLGWPVLAVVPRFAPVTTPGSGSLPVHTRPDSAEAEAFRTLRTTLAFLKEDTDRLSITSAEPGDGKTTVLANLGACFAQAGKRTLLIDADMRKPGLSRLFHLRRAAGLSDILRTDRELESMCREVIRSADIDHLDILPSGPKPLDPAELLSSPRMSELIAWAETHYDKVLVDCPPVLAASDAVITGRLVDGVLMIIHPDANRRREVLRAADMLATLQVHVVGVAVNSVCEHGAIYSERGKAYGYASSETEEEDLQQPEEPIPLSARGAAPIALRRRRAA